MLYGGRLKGVEGLCVVLNGDRNLDNETIESTPTVMLNARLSKEGINGISSNSVV